MYVTFSILIIGSMFVIMDLIPLYRNEEWAGFFLSGTLLLFSLILGLIMDLRVEVPSPADVMQKIITFIIGPISQ